MPRKNQGQKEERQSSGPKKKATVPIYDEGKTINKVAISKAKKVPTTLMVITTQNGAIKQTINRQQRSSLKTSQKCVSKNTEIKYESAILHNGPVKSTSANFPNEESAGISVVTLLNLAKEENNNIVKHENLIKKGVENTNAIVFSNPTKSDENVSRLSYYNSTSAININCTNSNELIDERNYKNEGPCKLPSSVYGMPTSNIENVLTGFHFDRENRSFVPTNIATSEPVSEKISRCLEKHCVNANIDKMGFNNSNEREIFIPSSNYVSDLPKLHIPSSQMFSDAMSITPESEKNANFPKITSPQILEQHITKIISQNAAIVETLDPLWSKRYLRQTSQNSDPEAKKARRVSNDKLSVDTGQSKLQSALLGTFDAERPSTSFLARKLDDMRERSFSTSAIPSTSSFPFTKFQNKSVEEDELKGNAIKSLLSLKQGHYNQNSINKDGIYNQHPQNPEGSIIKDLLLKNKSEPRSLGVDTDNMKSPPLKKYLKSLTETAIQCTRCSFKCYDEQTLQTHSTLCNANTVDLVEKIKSVGFPNGLLRSKLVTPDNMPILNPLTLSNNIEVLLKNDCDSPNSESIGQILKTQLLSKKSPPPKKRKISEPVIAANDTKKDDFATNYAYDGVLLSPQRCRSQSVHMFGGEVQIHDGLKTKRLKIISSGPSMSAVSQTDIATYEKGNKHEDTSFHTVVNIAQQVHNSGGTVTHIPMQKALSPIMSIANDITAYGIKTSIHQTFDSTLHPQQQPEPKFFSPPQFKVSDNVSVIRKIESPSSKYTSSGSQLKTFHYSPVIKQEKEKPLPYSSNPKSSVPRCILEKLEESQKETVKFPSSNQVAVESVSNESYTTKNRDKPSISLTPSSPTRSLSDRENDINATAQKFLAPTRPTSLPLKKKPFTMVGSTLISPDTPRPKKNCMQMYINGHAYTYLGLKCSTRSTYCCIYRPQPMYVLQDTDPKLSMYSNWQVVPAKEELCGMTPGQMLSLYNSKQTSIDSENISTTAKLGEPLSFTHSSYWKFRSSKRDENAVLNEDDEAQKGDTHEFEVESAQKNTKVSSPLVEQSTNSENTLFSPEKNIQFDSLSEKDSDLIVETSVSDAEENNSHDEDEEDDDDDDRTEVNTDSSQSQPPKRVRIFDGGFKSNEDYTYVRGRGRGKYVCEECGIRCKKPSMLKKHIRTHTDLRPYKCRHCSFAFKTKGNLTKHMKSKAHHKKCTELGIVPVPTTSDDSQIDGEFKLDDELRKKHFNSSDGEDIDDEDEDDEDLGDSDDDCESDSSSMAASSKNMSVTNGASLESDCADNAISEMDTSNANQDSQGSVEQEAARSLLHLSSLNETSQWSSNTGEYCNMISVVEMVPLAIAEKTELLSTPISSSASPVEINKNTVEHEQSLTIAEDYIGHRPRSYSANIPFGASRDLPIRHQQSSHAAFKVLASNELNESSEFSGRDTATRRYSISVAREARRPCIVQSPHWAGTSSMRVPLESLEQPMDLRIPRNDDLLCSKQFISSLRKPHLLTLNAAENEVPVISTDRYIGKPYAPKQVVVLSPDALSNYDSIASSATHTVASTSLQDQSQMSTNFSQTRYYVSEAAIEGSSTGRVETCNLGKERCSPEVPEFSACSPASVDESFTMSESTMAIPEGASTSVKPQAEFMNPGTSSNMEDGKCVCRICNKVFAKPGQLRIHVNIHYFERPFRCDNCGVSFRTKGHLQKHKRSVSHYNKMNMNMTFGTPSVDNPRPFKCGDCKIAFRIHGHLAKHLRSKMHIMKLECVGKLPFGMYAEMERSGISLNEIDTTDCNNSLESLQVMAQKLYNQDPRRVRWDGSNSQTDAEMAQPSVPAPLPQQQSPVSDSLLPVPEQLPVALTSPGATGKPMPSNLSPNQKIAESEVKPEPNEPKGFRSSAMTPASEVTEQSRNVQSHCSGSSESSISLHRSNTCHICGRMFKSAKFLQVHLYCDHSSWNSNSSEASAQSTRSTVIAQDLSCDLCGRHFPSQTALEQHLLSHTQLRPFVCEVCDAGFTSSVSLTLHLRTHHSSDIATPE